MVRIQRTCLPILLCCLATSAWPSDSAYYRQLEAAYKRSGEETISLAHSLLKNPGKLDVSDVLAANSYLCEALEDGEEYDKALAQARPVLEKLPTPASGDSLEFSARLLTCAGFGAKQKKLFPEAMSDFDRAIAMIDANHASEKEPTTRMVIPLSYALYRRAGLYDTLGDHAAALADLTRATRMLPVDTSEEGRKDDASIAAERMNLASALGRIHLHRQEFAQAAQAYESVLRYTVQIGDEHAEAIIELNLGECYRGLQRWQDSQDAYARALAIGTKLKDQVLLGRGHEGLGALARARKDDHGALENLALAHSELAAAQMPLELGNADLERAEVFADMHDWPQLAAVIEPLVTSLSGEGDKRLLSRALDLRARAREGQADLAGALADTRNEVALADELHRAELTDELAKRNVEFQVAQIEDKARLNARELEDKARLLERENQLANLQIRHERDTVLAQRAAIGVAVAIVLLLTLAIRRRILTQRLLTRLAQEDALTGLRNRRAALAAATEQFDATRRSGAKFALALLDIDHFKSINDTYGHAAGDAVLVAVAACMRESLRTDDICGRVGGEEFLFAFPRCDLDHARKLLDEVRATLAGLRFDGLPADFRVALSAGLTERRPDDDQLDVLVRRADVALYEAKRTGRDRVFVDAALAA